VTARDETTGEHVHDPLYATIVHRRNGEFGVSGEGNTEDSVHTLSRAFSDRYIVSRGGKIISTFVGVKRLSASAIACQRLRNCWRAGGAQKRFQLGESRLDGVERGVSRTILLENP
jgi:hypothetical protein